ncbi:squalene--hopene cyclase [Candidatus Methylacidithermus pantelleriae]|uniref:Squalene--hopene cyclase n=1 Tax=Candidatus Methylacidithermus pantelleriae TaxID=2744239 RepID=A0A8J2FTF6_9BACT|nr:squalene--hopene cyclase [Candidatus Methylacidithermus pantelleriae]CAF0704519.1 Squalene--hopene cyclase [Candidatus Methylacidithermus pantelleriae]
MEERVEKKVTALEERKVLPFSLIETARDLEGEAERAVGKAREFLLSLQREDGHWVFELLVDSTVVSDYLAFHHWWGKIDFEKQARFVKHILDRQLPDGGWSIYPEGPSELNATVKAYFALKLGGLSSDEPEMARARSTILRLGGLPACLTYTKLGLALLGVYPWEHLPSIPVEIILFPPWFPFSIYDLSSWTRGMVVPLSVLHHFKPTRFLPQDKQLQELFPYGTNDKTVLPFSFAWGKRVVSKRNIFLAVDRVLKVTEQIPWKPLRAKALAKAEAWILERVGEGSDGLGAIFPAMLYALAALRCLGYPDEHPVVKKAWRDLEALEVWDEKNADFRVQPCVSPVWDTAITMIALSESGLPPDHPSLRRAAEWLLSREVRFRGDWRFKNPFPEGSGWAFEYNNIYYPDVDDTAMVLLALLRSESSDPQAHLKAVERAFRWVESFQCSDGGWAAFDKDVNKKWLENVPFADHNAILDPPCCDITARVLELCGRLGVKRTLPMVQRAIRFLRRHQTEDGSWYGRWGVNYIYGTWQVLRGLEALGMDMNQPWILRGRDWLESCQNEDGGWGETCASYTQPELKGRGPSTASQTAWALMGIMACGDLERPSVERGIAYLCSLQNDDGSWTEDFITGTGFPGVFYLKYDSYRNVWPLLALSEYLRRKRGQKQIAASWARSLLTLAEWRSKRQEGSTP